MANNCVIISSDLGVLSNLICSLSRTIQQYSPPSEWIIRKLGFFPMFLENNILKVDKTLGLTFFIGKKQEDVSWTQRFLTGKIWSKNWSLFMTNKFESKCLQKLYFSSKQEKECFMKTTSYLEEPSRHFCQQFMRRTTRQNLFGYINLASQQKKKT